MLKTANLNLMTKIYFDALCIIKGKRAKENQIIVKRLHAIYQMLLDLFPPLFSRILS